MRLDVYTNPLRLLLFSCFSLLLFSCSATRFYSYDIQLEKPSPSHSLQFENDTIAISFTFKPKYIEYELYNKLGEGIKINWNEISISINEEAKSILHYSRETNEIFHTQPPTIIPPRSKFRDALIPRNRVNYFDQSKEYITSIQSSFPECDYGNQKTRKRAEQLKGKKILVYIPYYLGNAYRSKTFEFTVVDVKSRK